MYVRDFNAHLALQQRIGLSDDKLGELVDASQQF
jgi:hypothetical protein